MKNQQDNNNLYVDNPTVGYQEAQKQPSYEKKEPYNNEEDFYDEKDDSYTEEEFYANEEELDLTEEEPYDEKADKRAKRIKSFSNPFFVAAFLYVFWPFGLYCMWKYKVYNKIVRIIISILIPISSIYRLIRYVS